ncbi:ABC transporter ATP-binding protein [Cyclobacterium qasimii]|uniref:ABC transporter, ATP-binding protein n=2 Tax=Cyclobacterium qasimii TaxID=1350429 RepID=S7WYD4_9BACT|nr:ATP-binding cassette domain-containing protein [Cyclobacterium qasimii]EPR68968.1 ABC transporter, ATP-binding protein [Cyclobacterium qasimii M12-11B]GEO23918.1 ABC transporter ATP-binding protein [Cyclobacterium qasimii]
MEILSIRSLNKSYGSHVALKDFDLSVSQGKIFGLLGPNGAGKTTLIRIVNQIIDRDSGDIFINEQPLKMDHVRNIGYLPEERGLYKGMKVKEQLLYFAQIKGIKKTEAKQKITDWLEKLNLTQWKDKKIQDLSKGMAQKVQFIATVIHRPDLLILDEPFSGFDPVNAEIIKNEILELRNQGVTILLSTHRMESVELLCDEIAMVNRSRKILDGTVKSIKEEAKTNIFRVKMIPQNVDFVPPGEGLLRQDGILEFKLSLKDQKPNDLLRALMAEGEILGFEEIVPSIEEIFIQKINESHGE